MENKVDIKELQGQCFKILSYFSRVCEENKLKYSLAFGTLLGAVRHGSFIPWDDDIDVFMEIPDYEKLKTIFNKIDSPFELVDFNTDKNYPYLIPKIRLKDSHLIEKNISDLQYNIGIYIDIFLIQRTKGNKHFHLLNRLYQKINYRIYRYLTLNASELSFINRIIKKVVKTFFSLNKTVLRLQNVHYDKDGDTARVITEKCFVKASYINDFQTIGFYSEKFKVYTHYKEFLINFYGSDYMKLPPLEQRVSNHNFYEIGLPHV